MLLPWRLTWSCPCEYLLSCVLILLELEDMGLLYQEKTGSCVSYTTLSSIECTLECSSAKSCFGI